MASFLRRFAWGFVIPVLLIFRSYRTLRERLVMLAAYVRIGGKYFVGHRILKMHLRRERVLNYSVNVLDYNSFWLLFCEVFLLREYAFDSGDAPTILDCGANIGMTTLFIKWIHPDSRIVCFEPNPDAFRCLEKNVHDNGLDQVDLHEAAVSDNEGLVTFYSSESGRTADLEGSIVHSMQPGKTLSTQQVHCVRLSDYIRDTIDMLKLDVQGAEGEVIEELSKADKLRLVNSFIIEYHDDRENEQNRLGHLLHLLENAGFSFVIRSHYLPPYDHHAHKPSCFVIYAYK